jgi:hypothetical protein
VNSELARSVLIFKFIHKISPSIRLAEVLIFVLTEEVRVWDFYKFQKYKLLEDMSQTLHRAFIVDKQPILLEPITPVSQSVSQPVHDL